MTPRATWSPTQIDRYALGDRSGLTYDDDGSLTLYLQSDETDASTEANWLPDAERRRLQGRAQALLAQARGRAGSLAAAADRANRLSRETFGARPRDRARRGRPLAAARSRRGGERSEPPLMS